ncbi:hypothetical protein EST38_g1652 [Candolleomyces aberdarensis]|uniref:PEBP-like protein n=1 Tax=Candolleomyces aberdarensis TaxID=2316362 RepID=A0A4Q2DXJ7_9AGAR|nr:hypothetical protein EST38_g1652 [Candolleomyces aberdarensis]
MIALPIIASFALLPYVAAQESLPIQAIEAHFTQARIVPEYFDTFNPSATLELDYAGTKLTPGQKVTKEQVGPTPVVTVTPANSSVTLDGTYTIAMIDVDVVGAELDEGVTRHWLVNGVTIENGVVSNSSATAITPYAGPWPAAGSGPHRYIVALYQQPSTFVAPEGFTGPLPVGVYDFEDYVEDSGLGPLVAANYINVEEGTATASQVATSAVVTSTLPAAAAAGGSSTRSGGTTGTGTGTAAASTNTSGAIKLALSPIGALLAGLSIFAL